LQKRLQNELVIELINEITTILPDNTWVEQLVINGDEVQVRGQSLAAATLISIVEASEKFENATFRSPVVQDRRTGRDRFFLSAQIRKKTIDRENS
jgi:general secretion pathway protein L